MTTKSISQNPTAEQRLAVIKKAMKASQEERLAVLKRAGIVNGKGELTKQYRPTRRKKG